MIPHLSSVVVTIVLGSALVGGGMLLATLGYLRDVPGARRWAAGTLVHALGWLVFASLRGVLPEVVSVVAGQALIQWSFTLYLAALHDFHGIPFRLTGLYALLGGEMVVLVVLTAVVPDYGMRQVVISGCRGFVMLWCVRVLWRSGSHGLTSGTFVAAFLATAGGLVVLRGAIFLFGHIPVEGPFVVDTIDSISNVLSSITATVLPFGFVLLCNDRYVEDRRRSEEALQRMALVDALTQLPNRRMLTERLRHIAMSAVDQPDSIHAVLFIDVDNFKYVNDSLGHEAGDELLVETARRLDRVLRQDDVVACVPTATAGRFGGDEFVVVLERLPTPAAAASVAEHILAVMTQPFTIGSQTLAVRCSIGVSINAHHHTAIEDLLRAADTAMYHAKAAGKGNYVLFDESMHVEARDRLRLENDLRTAIETDQIYTVYQPIIDLTTGRVAAFEALVRWAHPERGTVGPNDFIPIAEETGLIVPMGERVLEQAVATLERLTRLPGGEALCMNVNVSRRQLADSRFHTAVAAVVAGLTVPPARLRLEITETAVSGTSPLIREALQDLKALGVQIHLDDFGTGLSSLSLLRTLPLDGIKVDRSFIDAASGDVQAITILNAIVALGHNLGKTITAEGLATRDQVAAVLALDCDLAQGFLFGAPMAAAAAEAAVTTDYSTHCVAA